MLGLQLCLSFVPPQKAPGGWRERETLHETNWPLAAWAIGGGAQQREGSAMPQGHCAELIHNDWQNNIQRYKHHGIIVKLRTLLSPALLSLRLPGCPFHSPLSPNFCSPMYAICPRKISSTFSHQTITSPSSSSFFRPFAFKQVDCGVA